MRLDRYIKRGSLGALALSALLLLGVACEGSDGDGDLRGPNLEAVEERLRDAFDEVEGMTITGIDEADGTLTVETNWEDGPADELCDHMPEVLPGVDTVVFEDRDGQQLESCPA